MDMTEATDTVTEIIEACRSREGLPYDGEPVDQLQHALQSARIASLVEQHAPAKRYLVAVDPEYAATLSPVSAQTLIAHGGAMSAAEIAAFRSSPDWEFALALRRIDDRAKVEGLAVPPIADYREALLEVARAAREN